LRSVRFKAMTAVCNQTSNVIVRWSLVQLYSSVLRRGRRIAQGKSEIATAGYSSSTSFGHITAMQEILLNFMGSAVLVWIAYVAQTLVPCCTIRKWNYNDYRLLFAALFSLVVGVVKEMTDAILSLNMSSSFRSSLILLRREFDFWDLIIDVNGIAAALVWLIFCLWVTNQCKDNLPPCDETVASSIVTGVYANELEDMELGTRNSAQTSVPEDILVSEQAIIQADPRHDNRLYHVVDL
jgi:hypothetical protein